MRILCIGDSLGLPRNGVKFEETWYYRLMKSYPDFEFIQLFKRAMLINDAAMYMYDNYYTYYYPDIVIIQTGICDCAPRSFDKNSRRARIILKICDILHITSFFWNVVKKRERREDRVYTSRKDFAELYGLLIKKIVDSGTKKIIIIEIGHGADSILEKSKYFNSNVDEYNKIIETVGNLYPNKIRIINPLDKVADDFFVDGYHCNKKGMDKVYQMVELELRRIVDEALQIC